eukprot:1607532-Alexandrium_andersonii.AAC.1
MIEENWVAAIMNIDETGKKKALCFNEDFYKLDQITWMVKDLWPRWLDYDKRNISSSTSSSSTSFVDTLMDTSTKVYYPQDFHEIEVQPLQPGLIAALAAY